ncbi:hypothetical protein BKA82DRAFT_1002104, partial [Pisolithus tinctorius]
MLVVLSLFALASGDLAHTCNPVFLSKASVTAIHCQLCAVLRCSLRSGCPRNWREPKQARGVVSTFRAVKECIYCLQFWRVRQDPNNDISYMSTDVL